MKNLIFAVLLLASFSANAGHFKIRTSAEAAFWFGASENYSSSEYYATGQSSGYHGDLWESEGVPIEDISVIQSTIFFQSPSLYAEESILATLTWNAVDVDEGSFKAYIFGWDGGNFVSNLTSGSFQFELNALDIITILVSASSPNITSAVSYTLTGTPLNPSEVPLPAPILLFLSGIAYFAFLRRRSSLTI